jgi:hypothetical protein
MPLPQWYTPTFYYKQSDLDQMDLYNKQIEDYRAQAEAYNAALEKYKADVEQYNKRVETWNAGPRTSDFGYTAPAAFTTERPADLGFTQEDLDAFQQEAQSRATRSRQARQTAYEAALDPNRFNLAGFGFAEGGEVSTAAQYIKDYYDRKYGDKPIRYVINDKGYITEPGYKALLKAQQTDQVSSAAQPVSSASADTVTLMGPNTPLVKAGATPGVYMSASNVGINLAPGETQTISRKEAEERIALLGTGEPSKSGQAGPYRDAGFSTPPTTNMGTTLPLSGLFTRPLSTPSTPFVPVFPENTSLLSWLEGYKKDRFADGGSVSRQAFNKMFPQKFFAGGLGLATQNAAALAAPPAAVTPDQVDTSGDRPIISRNIDAGIADWYQRTVAPLAAGQYLVPFLAAAGQRPTVQESRGVADGTGTIAPDAGEMEKARKLLETIGKTSGSLPATALPPTPGFEPTTVDTSPSSFPEAEKLPTAMPGAEPQPQSVDDFIMRMGEPSDTTDKEKPAAAPLERVDLGWGLEQLANDDIALMGGMRSGSSMANEMRLRYTIHDLAKLRAEGAGREDLPKYQMGYVDLFVEDGTGKVNGLVNIEMDRGKKKQGMGRRVIEALLASDFVGDKLYIHDIEPKAKGFWKKMGAYPVDRTEGRGYDVSAINKPAPRTTDQFIAENATARNALDAFTQQAIQDAENDSREKSREVVVEMNIDDFLNLAEEGKDAQKEARLKDVDQFNQIPHLSTEGEQVVGHEGRNRARRMKELGYTTMPVRIIDEKVRWGENPDVRFDTLKAESGDFSIEHPVKPGEYGAYWNQAVDTIRSEYGSLKVYTDVKNQRDNRPLIDNFIVKEDKRNQGYGKELLQNALAKYPNAGAMVGSVGSLKAMYDVGMRSQDYPRASFDELKDRYKDDGFLYMVAQPSTVDEDYFRGGVLEPDQYANGGEVSTDDFIRELLTEDKAVQDAERTRGQYLQDESKEQKYENVYDALFRRNIDVKTNEDYRPDLLPVFRSAAIRAVMGDKPTAGVDYEHYPALPSGRSARGVVSDRESRSKMTAADELSLVNDAIKSIGGGTLKTDEKGNVYLTDYYDFNMTDPTKVRDLYGAQRFGMGLLDKLGMLHNYRTELNLGSKYDLFPALSKKEVDEALQRAGVQTFTPQGRKVVNPDPIGGTPDGA